MKTTLIKSTILLFLFSQNLFSQMDDGKYKFSNNVISLDFTVSENGQTISSASIVNATTKKTSTGQGIYRSANNIEWYEFQTSDCDYEFDIPTDKLVLSQFDNKNGLQTTKYTLTKKVANWTGTFKNSSDGVLVISNYKDGVSFDYKLAYGGTSSCSGIELAGTAKITSNATATAGDDEDNPITLELNGNKIIFSPSCCDGMAGMECLKFFDSDFKK